MSLIKENYLKDNISFEKTENINEEIDINEKKTIDVAILFTDMVKSSNGWKNHPSEMINALEEQSIVIDKLVKANKGFICKTIGDSFMISFKKLEESIQCALDLQKELKENPIIISGKTVTELRVGICYGPVFESKIKIQNTTLKDYFGNTVNTAARLESGVSKAGGVAFAITTEDASDIDVDSIIKDLNVELITFKNKGDEIRRSQRVLTDVHRHIYKNIDKLKGIDKIDVYNIKKIK